MSSRRRGYRSMQADAQRGTVTCPRCHCVFATEEGGAAVKVPDLSAAAGFPDRTPEQRRARLVELQSPQDRLHAALRERVGESSYHLWLAPLRLVDAAGGTLFLVAPAEIVGWLRDRFGPVIEEAASTLAGRPVRVIVAASGGVA